MPFEKGNKLGERGRMFEGALRKAIASDDGKRLRLAADQLLDQASYGQPWAIQYLADRLDGKAKQSIAVERKTVSEMSLGELTDELAASIAGGGAEADSSADQPNGLH